MVPHPTARPLPKPSDPRTPLSQQENTKPLPGIVFEYGAHRYVTGFGISVHLRTFTLLHRLGLVRWGTKQSSVVYRSFVIESGDGPFVDPNVSELCVSCLPPGPRAAY